MATKTNSIEYEWTLPRMHMGGVVQLLNDPATNRVLWKRVLEVLCEEAVRRPNSECGRAARWVLQQINVDVSYRPAA